jgi:hypothetical protein
VGRKGDVSTSTSPNAVRCPRCSAHVRTGSDWCTLCYADLRPAPPVAEPVAALEPEPLSTPVEPVDLPVAETVEAVDLAPAAPLGRGKHAKRASTAALGAPPEVEALADQMLAELAVTRSNDRLSSMVSALDEPGKKIGFIIGGVIGATCVLFIVLTTLGAVFS